MKVYGWTTDDQHPVMALGVLKKKQHSAILKH
jgi:hypothetical protein